MRVVQYNNNIIWDITKWRHNRPVMRVVGNRGKTATVENPKMTHVNSFFSKTSCNAQTIRTNNHDLILLPFAKFDWLATSSTKCPKLPLHLLVWCLQARCYCVSRSEWVSLSHKTSWTLHRSQSSTDLHQTCHQGRVPGGVVTYCFWWKSEIFLSAKPEVE